MTLESILTILISSFSASGITGFLFSRRLERDKEIQLQRQKAALVASLFSKWIKYSSKGTKHLDERELCDYHEELNRMSLELALWMPEEELLKKIMDRLANKTDAENIRSLTVKVRKLILNSKSNFRPEDIVLWEK